MKMRSGSSPVKIPAKYYDFTFDLMKYPHIKISYINISQGSQMQIKNTQTHVGRYGGLTFSFPQPSARCPRCPKRSSSHHIVQIPAGCQEAPLGNSAANKRCRVVRLIGMT